MEHKVRAILSDVGTVETNLHGGVYRTKDQVRAMVAQLNEMTDRLHELSDQMLAMLETEGDWRPNWVIEAERQQEAAMRDAPPVALAYERPPNVPLSWHRYTGSDGRVGWIPPAEERGNVLTDVYYPDTNEWTVVYGLGSDV